MAYFTVFIVVCVLLQKFTADGACANKYPSCGPDKMNIVCQNNEDCSALAPCVGLPSDAKFRKWILDKHNELRNGIATGVSKIQGKKRTASNMNLLQYDKDLEFVAQCTIRTCEYRTDHCIRTARFPLSVGQNYLIGSTRDQTEKNVKNMIQVWYDEIKYANMADMDKFNKEKIGRFTQLIWARTTHVGCARTKDEEGRIYLVCSYGTGGNIIGESVYKSGTPCQDCDSCDTRYPGLGDNCRLERTARGFAPSSTSYTILSLLYPVTVSVVFNFVK